MHPIGLMFLYVSSFFLFGVWQETAMRWVGPSTLFNPTGLYDKIVLAVGSFVLHASDAMTGGGGHYRAGWVFLGVVLGTLAVVLVIIIAVGVALVAQAILRLLPMGFVWYRFFDSLFVHLSFTQTPVTAECVEFRDVGKSASVLMHSAIYHDELVLTRLAEVLQTSSPTVQNP
jgi:hypothetical protein